MLSHSEAGFRSWSPPRWAALWLAAALGCVGSVGDGAGPEANGTATETRPPTSGAARTGTAGGTTATTAPGACAVAPAPWRKLTSFEYQNTVRDLFPGLDVGPALGELSTDVIKDLFDNQSAV